MTPPPENGLTVERVRELRGNWANEVISCQSHDINPHYAKMMLALCDAWLAAHETDEQGIPLDKRAHQLCECARVQAIDNGWRLYCPDCNSFYRRNRRRGGRGWEYDPAPPNTREGER